MKKHLLPCAAASIALVLGGALPAHAAEPDPIQLSWDGSDYADTVVESFVGTPVAVPGDSVQRTLHVRNDGPSDGTLTVTITHVELLDPDAGLDDSFYDDVIVDWGTGSGSLAAIDDAGDTSVLTRPLAMGETTEVTIGYDFPIDATSGNRSDVGDRQASFDVVFTLGGDIAEPVPTTPPPVTPEPTDSPEPPRPTDTPEPSESPTPPAPPVTPVPTEAPTPEPSVPPVPTPSAVPEPRETEDPGLPPAEPPVPPEAGGLSPTGGSVTGLAILGAAAGAAGLLLLRQRRARGAEDA
jgi:hypothetical protein